MPRLRIVISGRVQGVFFRASIVEHARTAGLTGWVRNWHDGSVETVAEGASDALARLRKFCATGPHGAVVRKCDVYDEPETGEFREFVVRADSLR